MEDEFGTCVRKCGSLHKNGFTPRTYQNLSSAGLLRHINMYFLSGEAYVSAEERTFRIVCAHGSEVILTLCLHHLGS